MNYPIYHSQSPFPGVTVKSAGESCLIPVKIRHFYEPRNFRLGQWRDEAPFKDQIRLIFDAGDYLKKSSQPGAESGFEELYQDEHVIIVNKLEGMKTHANEPTEIALLNHVSQICWITCYVVHRLNRNLAGSIYLPECFYPAHSQPHLEKIKTSSNSGP